jgi:uncharacterized repeat protein (TIGR03803 family)
MARGPRRLCRAYGAGTVVEAIPADPPPWWCKVLHSFNNLDGADGFGPEAGLVSDAYGGLYGTTLYGGTTGGGTAFQLTSAHGVWKEAVLHSFGSVAADGINPEGGLIFDNAGSLYGTTTGGGLHGGGTLFKITATPTSTSLTSVPNPSIFGQSVTFMATVSATATPPDGSVAFKSGSATLGTATMTGGTANFATTTLKPGTRSITAAYAGNAMLFAASASAVLAQVVTKASTSITLTSSSNPSIAGGAVTFTAIVNPPYGGIPTGNVTFKDGNTTLGSVALSGNLAGYVALALSSGTHKITATYSGNANFTHGSAILIQVVN